MVKNLREKAQHLTKIHNLAFYLSTFKHKLLTTVTCYRTTKMKFRGMFCI